MTVAYQTGSLQRPDDNPSRGLRGRIHETRVRHQDEAAPRTKGDLPFHARA